jgi:hypothetical protein
MPIFENTPVRARDHRGRFIRFDACGIALDSDEMSEDQPLLHVLTQKLEGYYVSPKDYRLALEFLIMEHEAAGHGALLVEYQTLGSR